MKKIFLLIINCLVTIVRALIKSGIITVDIERLMIKDLNEARKKVKETL